MSRLQFVSLVRQTTPEGEKDFFFNGKEWQRLSAPPQPAPEPGVAPEEEASADTLPEP